VSAWLHSSGGGVGAHGESDFFKCDALPSDTSLIQLEPFRMYRKACRTSW